MMDLGRQGVRERPGVRLQKVMCMESPGLSYQLRLHRVRQAWQMATMDRTRFRLSLTGLFGIFS